MMDGRWYEWRRSATDVDEGCPEQWTLTDEDAGHED